MGLGLVFGDDIKYVPLSEQRTIATETNRKQFARLEPRCTVITGGFLHDAGNEFQD